MAQLQGVPAQHRTRPAQGAVSQVNGNRKEVVGNSGERDILKHLDCSFHWELVGYNWECLVWITKSDISQNGTVTRIWIGTGWMKQVKKKKDLFAVTLNDYIEELKNAKKKQK